MKMLSTAIIALFLLVCLLAVAGCKDEKKIAAKLWLIDSQDATLYRIAKKPDGTEFEQYYFIKNNEKMKDFACMIASDRKLLYDAWTRCGCSL